MSGPVYGADGQEDQVRATSNPAFRNLPRNGYGNNAGFNPQAQTGPQPYGAFSGQGDRPMTIDDVVTKTAITLGVAVIVGALTVAFQLWFLAVPGLIVGLIASLIIIFRRTPSPALVLTYAVAEGAL